MNNQPIEDWLDSEIAKIQFAARQFPSNDWPKLTNTAKKAILNRFEAEILAARLEELENIYKHWRQTYQSEKVISRVEQRIASLSKGAREDDIKNT